jgi:regulator of cell morphogenesis and NO signaling
MPPRALARGLLFFKSGGYFYMQNFTTKTIREIAVESPATVPVFEEYKIDFCCGGNRNFYDACQSVGVSPEIVSDRIIQVLSGQSKDSESLEQKNASALIDYIVEKHHVFTKAEISRLSALTEKVCRKHAEAHPELFDLRQLFTELCDDLTPHMMKEENVLFPFIKHLEMSRENNLSSPYPPFGTVKNPVRMMMVEHDTAGDLLKKMRGITKDYALPEGVCPSFQALYFGLEEFEKDLHRHIHLENNVLFPNAVNLEQTVTFVF